MRGSDFTFDYVHLFYYERIDISLKLGGSHTDSPDQIKNKKAAIDCINKKDNKWFHYAVTAALSYEEFKKDFQRIIKIKAFIDKYNWEGTNYPLEKDD